MFTCEFYLFSLQLYCYLLSRLVLQQGLLITWGRSAPALDDSPSPKEDGTTSSWAMEILKQGLGLSVYPKEQRLGEQTFCVWLIPLVLSGRAERVGMSPELSLGHRADGFTRAICPVSRVTEPVLKFMALWFQKILKGTGLSTGSFLWLDSIILKVPTRRFPNLNVSVVLWKFSMKNQMSAEILVKESSGMLHQSHTAARI